MHATATRNKLHYSESPFCLTRKALLNDMSWRLHTKLSIDFHPTMKFTLNSLLVEVFIANTSCKQYLSQTINMKRSNKKSGRNSRIKTRTRTVKDEYAWSDGRDTLLMTLNLSWKSGWAWAILTAWWSWSRFSSSPNLQGQTWTANHKITKVLCWSFQLPESLPRTSSDTWEFVFFPALCPFLPGHWAN